MKSKEFKDLEKSAKKIHSIWWNFCKHMTKWYYKEVDEYRYDKDEFGQPTGKKVKEFDVTQMAGYDCMCRVQKYAEKHPEIVVVGVDDELYAGSYLVLIPHPTHGITMIFIPQCTTINNQWFLYPSYLKGLQTALEEMKKKYSNFDMKLI
jgi:hypothetical protein